MSKIIRNFNNLSVNLNKSQRIQAELITSAEKESLLKRGFYNGSLTGCVDYKIQNRSLILECVACNFFELILDKFIEKDIPKILNANAIIEVGDSIILIKRGEDVYSYNGYWDFPAGLVQTQESPLNRLKKRIPMEIGINPKYLSFSDFPAFVEILDRYFSLYYIVKTSLSKEEVISRIKQNSEGNKSLLLSKYKIVHFLNRNKKVFPRSPLIKYSAIKT